MRCEAERVACKERIADHRDLRAQGRVDFAAELDGNGGESDRLCAWKPYQRAQYGWEADSLPCPQGVLLYFNETTANQNFTSTQIPWIAYISCDDAMQNYTMPANSSIPAATNGTVSAGGNSTQTVSVLQQAEQLGAKGIVLYSTREQVRQRLIVLQSLHAD